MSFKYQVFKTAFSLLSLASCALQNDTLDASFTIRNGKIIEISDVPTMSCEKHFEAGALAIKNDEWEEAAYQFKMVTENFPTTPYGHEGYYYLAISYYYLAEYDLANNLFSEYLQCQTSPRFFQETIQYKLAIADRLAHGAKRRLFGTKKLPKWACGKELALEIYDEVIAAVPCHEIASQALIAKGYLLWTMGDHKAAVESFQLVIKRFAKSEFAPESFLLISKVYVDQAYRECQNPDILAFAEINLGRFEKQFPREERLLVARDDLRAIKEIYANGLYQMGLFYERTCQKHAAIIYYYNAIHQFPDTAIAEMSRCRLLCLDVTYQDPYVEEEPGDLCEDDDQSMQEEIEEIEPRSQGVFERRGQLSGS